MASGTSGCERGGYKDSPELGRLTLGKADSPNVTETWAAVWFCLLPFHV